MFAYRKPNCTQATIINFVVAVIVINSNTMTSGDNNFDILTSLLLLYWGNTKQLVVKKKRTGAVTYSIINTTMPAVWCVSDIVSAK